MLLYYDENERFMPRFRAIWEKATRKNRQARGWPRQVGRMLPIKSKDAPGIQMADLIAWSANRYQTMKHMQRRDETDMGFAMVMNLLAGMSLRHQVKIYDYAALVRYSEAYRRYIEEREGP
jgi:hypothetical protein